MLYVSYHKPSKHISVSQFSSITQCPFSPLKAKHDKVNEKNLNNGDSFSPIIALKIFETQGSIYNLRNCSWLYKPKRKDDVIRY